ncbi:PD-(D/E)XK nuclease-like domain-containing protein [Limibacter armeniacum]|uniref:PD-(D/E)XK nuclease-like domain-containing protein n=1 Tax=Limibacter armeniacum TaxID=466084 RepID=UPI002FE5A029
MLKVNYKIITMPEEDYRHLPALSNSDLTVAKHLLAGIPHNKPMAAFRFGRAVHMCLLEPERWKHHAQTTDTETALKVELLANAARQNEALVKLLAKCYTRKEQVVLWQDPITGIDCKARIDLLRERQLVADLKTTRVASLEGFISDAERFDYDRQMAFYGMAIQPKRYLLAGTSKKKLGSVYFISLAQDDHFILRGKQKVAAIIRALQKQPAVLRQVLEARNP